MTQLNFRYIRFIVVLRQMLCYSGCVLTVLILKKWKTARAVFPRITVFFSIWNRATLLNWQFIVVYFLLDFWNSGWRSPCVRCYIYFDVEHMRFVSLNCCSFNLNFLNTLIGFDEKQKNLCFVAAWVLRNWTGREK